MPNHMHGIIEIADGRGTMHRAPTVEQFGKPTSNTSIAPDLPACDLPAPSEARQAGAQAGSDTPTRKIQ